ncbi:MAG: tetratricopeptide repeat protein [Burkholderiaceae bacterium]|nr:tetratricopeptide repeat protein [Burkholderiaceae bacterium]
MLTFESFTVTSQPTHCMRAASLTRLQTGTWRLLAALLAACAIVPAAQAQPLAERLMRPEAALIDNYPEVRVLWQQRQADKALAALQMHAAAKKNDPAYHNLVGQMALQMGRYPMAAAAFERVVLMQPDNAGAWLDLAIATAESGNLAAAFSYFEHVETEFAPPPEMRALILAYRQHYQRRDQARAQPKSGWDIRGQAGGGWDTNANSGLLDSIIPLTVSGQRVPLTLDPSYLPRGDWFAKVGLNAKNERPTEYGQLVLLMGAQQRSYQNEHAFSTLDLNFSAGLIRPTVLGDLGTWLHLEHLSLGGSPLMKSMRAAVQIERPYAGCRIGYGIEAEARRYQGSSATLDGNLLWLQAGLACNGKLHYQSVQSSVIARVGLDDPQGSRAGGRSRHGEIVAMFALPLAHRVTAEFSAALARVRDADGYSPLLDNNDVRTVTRRNLQFAVSHPISASTDLQWVIEDSRISSNLELFQQSGRRYSVGLRTKF